MCKHYPSRDSMDCHACHDELRNSAILEVEKANLFGSITEPPIDIKPQLFWIEERIDALIAAIQRYQHASKPIPIEWTNELWSHTNWLKNNK